MLATDLFVLVLLGRGLDFQESADFEETLSISCCM